MRKRLLWLFGLLLSVGPTQCSCTDVELGATEQDLSKQDLERDGYTCEATAPHGGSYTCTKCESFTTTDSTGTHKFTECWSVGCTGYPDGHTECASQSASLPSFWMEAEDTTLYGAIQKTTDGNASAGSALSVAGSGSTRATFATDVAATVTAWVRVIAPSTSASSIYIQLDATPAVRWEIPTTTTWAWLPVHASWSLAAGTHALRFYADEVGVRIDRVVLAGDPAFVPVAQTYQAEAAALVAPMQTGFQRTIPAVGYIWVPNGGGTGGLAQLQISVPRADTYMVWGRVSAPSDADNSFSIGLLGEPRTAWSMPSASGWAWDRADVAGQPVLLPLDGFDVLEIAEREDGTKLDKLVLTNDPGFTLVEPSSDLLLAP